MASDNDGELASSSGAVVRPSPVPTTRGSAAAAESKCMLAKGMLAKGMLAKGILVHCNNKRSANTHRVSFDVSSRLTTPTPSPSPSPSPSPTVFRDKNDGKRSRRRQLDDGPRTPLPQQRPSPVLPSASYGPLPPTPLPPPPPYSAQDCRRTSGFGVKSYLHEFYDDPAEDHFQSFQDDDFKYYVEPEFRWRGHCGGVYAVLGLAAVTIGAVIMAAGHLIPAKDPVVVGRSADAEVVDRWAVDYNEYLLLCRYVGSAVLAVGVVFTVVRFWVSVIRSQGAGDRLLLAPHKKLAAEEYGRRIVNVQNGLRTVRIPVTGSVETVQPEPGAIRVQFSDIS